MKLFQNRTLLPILLTVGLLFATSTPAFSEESWERMIEAEGPQRTFEPGPVLPNEVPAEEAPAPREQPAQIDFPGETRGERPGAERVTPMPPFYYVDEVKGAKFRGIKGADRPQLIDLPIYDQIAAGGGHSLALRRFGGTVWAWGYNKYGQLGDGTNIDKNKPVQVSGLTNVTVIAGLGNHSLVLKGDGTVWAWGYNFFGQLGDGTNIHKYTPVQVQLK